MPKCRNINIELFYEQAASAFGLLKVVRRWLKCRVLSLVMESTIDRGALSGRMGRSLLTLMSMKAR